MLGGPRNAWPRGLYRICHGRLAICGLAVEPKEQTVRLGDTLQSRASTCLHQPPSSCPPIREKRSHGSAPTELALRTHAPAMRFDEVPHDCKAKPGSARLSRARTIDSVEALEDAGQVLGRDADPCVANREPDPRGWGISCRMRIR